MISLSQVPLCLANKYSAACVTKAWGSVEGWIAKEGTWYVFRLTGGVFKWSYAASGLWFGLLFRGICDCTTKSPAVFAVAVFPCWLLTAHGRCHWRSNSDSPRICFLVKQKGQLTTSLLKSLGVSGGAAREWVGVGEPQVHFVIYSVLCTWFWDSTWRQLGARPVMVTNARITAPGQTRCLSPKYPASDNERH